MKEIALTRGLVALVDDDDFDWLTSMGKWSAQPGRHTFYAVKNVGTHGKSRSAIMHRLIIGAKQGEIVDHVDRNGLNNQRSNLRICDTSQNISNCGLHANNKSGHSGVFWVARISSWKAQIMIRGHHMHLGYFKKYDDAVEAYENKNKTRWAA